MFPIKGRNRLYRQELSGFRRELVKYYRHSNLGRTPAWQGQLKLIHQKIQTGAGIEMLVHFTGNAGFPAMKFQENQCIRSFA